MFALNLLSKYVLNFLLFLASRRRLIKVKMKNILENKVKE